MEKETEKETDKKTEKENYAAIANEDRKENFNTHDERKLELKSEEFDIKEERKRGPFQRSTTNLQRRTSKRQHNQPRLGAIYTVKVEPIDTEDFKWKTQKSLPKVEEELKLETCEIKQDIESFVS